MSINNNKKQKKAHRFLPKKTLAIELDESKQKEANGASKQKHTRSI